VAGLYDSLTRDLVVLHKGDSITTAIDATMAATGWAGGTFVRWTDAGTGELTVTLANGVYCGFAPFGSEESGDGFAAITGQNPRYKYVTMFFGGNVFYTRTYETETYKSRNGLEPYNPLTYTANQALYVSENGKLTNQDESDLAVNPTGLFPDGSPITIPFVFFGVCCVPPSSASRNYIAVQTNFGV
jgi:hypothetical protein